MFQILDTHAGKPRTKDGTRLEKLILNTKLTEQHRHELEIRMGKIILLQQIFMYGGALVFTLYSIKNKFRITKLTPVLIIVPFFLQTFTKYVGYKWIDLSLEDRRVYE